MSNIAKITVAVASALLLFVPAALSQSGKKLNVKVAYRGAGEVDAGSPIHLYLFDTPNISEGSMPVGWTSVSENGSVATFQGLNYATVYLVGAYGSYDAASGPPPSGTPVALFRPGDPAGATPIALAKEETEISFEFDDSFRMP